MTVRIADVRPGSRFARCRAPVLLAGLVTAAMVLLGPARRSDAGDVGRLMAVAEDRGTVRVLARLDVPAAPEGLLGPEAVAAQRRAIATSCAQMEQDLAGTDWRMTREFKSIPWVALEVTPEALAALTFSGVVRDVAEDRVERVMLPRSVPLVQGDAAWAAGFEGTGWTVAVLDTGVFSEHPFLAGKVVSEACYSLRGDCPNGQTSQTGPGAAAPCSYADLACPHGTHVAGIAAGLGQDFSGVARRSDIIAIQVFSMFSGSDCDDDVEDPCAKTFTADTIAGLERVFELRDTFNIAAANLSLGGGSFFSQAACDLEDSARKAVIDNLRSVGIATVAASGNEASPNALSAPGCVSSAFSVGAVNDRDQVAGFSNSASFLTFLAPGVQVLSSAPFDGFQVLSGTSEATPHVSGAFAVLNQRLGRSDVDLVANALASTGLPVQDPRNGLIKPRIRILDALNSLPEPGAPSGLQITPDGARTLISKDVGGERWAITSNPEDGTVTGNVFSPDGGEPKFVWCQRTGDNGDPNPETVLIDFACSGADACELPSCPVDQWTLIAENVTLPGSFFLPPSGQTTSTAAAASPPGEAAGVSPSGLQITPDLQRTLISKDVGLERWAITLNPDDTVTGNVFQPEGGDPKFVWCERIGDDGNPDPGAVLIDFSCFGADRCTAGPCSPAEWSAIGEVTLPGSFFLPG